MADRWHGYFKRGHDEVIDELVEESLHHISQGAARDYLGRFGDTVDQRVRQAIEQAERLLEQHETGPAITVAVTAVELMIRFLVIRPLVQGAFLSDEWAAILADRIATGRTAADRDLLPRVLNTFGIDVTTIQTPSGVRVWECLKGDGWPARDGFVHRYDDVDPNLAQRVTEAAKVFRDVVVQSIAERLGFTLAATGKWSEIRGREYRTFTVDDPFRR
jgi:hypothetical protein